jgi:hypothetical protein
VTTNESIETRLASIFDAPLSPELRESHPRPHRPHCLARANEPAGSGEAIAWPRDHPRDGRRAGGRCRSDRLGSVRRHPFQPGWETAWEHSVEIGQERTVEGQVIRLERGYADSNQVVLGWTGTLPEGTPGSDSAGRLTDEAGRNYRPSDGAGTDAVPGGVTLGTFLPTEPLPAGDIVFTLSLADGVSFNFTLPVTGGTEVAIGGTVIASDFAVTLEEFRAGRSSLLAYLSLEALQGAPDGEAWTPIGHLEIDGRRINLSAIRDDQDGRLIASAVEGVENSAGTWKVVIDELVGHNAQWPDNEQIRVSGPWVFEFQVPGS